MKIFQVKPIFKNVDVSNRFIFYQLKFLKEWIFIKKIISRKKKDRFEIKKGRTKKKNVSRAYN